MEEHRVNFVTVDDKQDWRPLFDGYAAFYKTPITDRIADQVWDWLLDPAHELEGLIARDQRGKALGIAHVRACPRSLAGGYIGFLDDMFVVPEARGSGAADALFSRLNALAQERGWSALRWITQHFNERGRAFYDRYTGGPSDFIVYQLNREQ
ncbi:GNAT family N-acetyltransferase [Marinobacter bryozoorum]|jgi:GNAT superfamily N-acetyltransferase|uniref:GNAT family N-acetyltransferase n=1 Tax=Marinobacter bryozoorum TaxID=256324 RepID=UPI00200603AD|nr:GNAT family N-acetyltransferase [Marinobacter bryozoorum]MCK7543598.1 GNAT family N-acetyltransferase [Marinobacter bryozoorum]